MQIRVLESLRQENDIIIKSLPDAFAVGDLDGICSWLVKGQYLNVTWDIMAFLKPLFQFIPASLCQQLTDGKAVNLGPIRIWAGITRHGRVLGITYHENTQGNVYQKKEIEIYELKQYFDKAPANPEETKVMAEKLVKTLESMGLPANKLTSAATIYKEYFLDHLPVSTIGNMGEEFLEAHELALNNYHEWQADFKSMPHDNLFSYDITAAYPAALAELPNLKYCAIEHLTELPPPGMFYGIMEGTIHNKTLVSPLINPDTGRPSVGFWKGTLNTWEYDCLTQWGIADFEIKDGWFIRLDKYVKPFDYSMRRLYAYRNGAGELQNNLAKAMAVSVWGRFLEERPKEYGEYFNPIYADMVTSLVRIKVADFIYKNKLQDDVVSITVDGVKSLKKVDVSPERNFGEWRFNE